MNTLSLTLPCSGLPLSMSALTFCLQEVSHIPSFDTSPPWTPPLLGHQTALPIPVPGETAPPQVTHCIETTEMEKWGTAQPMLTFTIPDCNKLPKEEKE